MKVAIVHEWFNIIGGSEKVVQNIIEIFPESDVFCLFDFLETHEREKYLLGKKTKQSFLQNFPFIKKYYTYFLPLFPKAIESLSLNNYDLIISSSHSVAKGIKKNNNQLHICYCHTPMRYAWDLKTVYLEKFGLIPRFFANIILNNLKIWDKKVAENVDFFVANSEFVKKRINNFYQKDAKVIFPPVDVSAFEMQSKKEDFFITASRLVSYKNIDAIINIFNTLPDEKLVIIGDGNQRKYLEKIAKKNISFLGKVSDKLLQENLQKAKCFIFAAEEDFGILPVEAQACGTPIIAYAKGGALETVNVNVSGIFFENLDNNDLKEAIIRFKNLTFDAKAVRNNALKFNKESFKINFKLFVDECIQKKNVT